MQTYLIVPDIHVPYHCPKAVKLVTKILKETPTINGMVLLGDFVDAFQISTYSKDPQRRNLLVDDINDFKFILNEWSRHLKDGSTIHILEGNHEARLSRYIANQARDLHGLVPDWPSLLGIDLRNKVGQHKWHWHPYFKWNSCQIGDCTFFHGFYFNEHVAMQCLKKYRTNCVFGHTHRLQYVFDGQHFACSLGHISNETETAHQPTPSGWQQAVGLLHVDKLGKTSLDIIPINKGKAVLYGKQISV